MRSLYSKDIIENPYKVSPFQQRSRLKSLKELRQIPIQQIDLQSKISQQQIFQLLEKKLIEDNYKQENQQIIVLTEPKKHSLLIPSKHSIKEQSQKKLQSFKQSNKLFQYFEELFKKQVPAEKVEREKVNFCEKQLDEIRGKVQSKLEMNKTKLNELKQNVKAKYLQLHEYHEQAKELTQKIKQEVKAKLLSEAQKKQRFERQGQKLQIQKPTSTVLSLRPPSIKQKLYLLQQTITFLKQQISKLQQEIQAITNKETSIQEEWIMFLKLFLNSGYYLSDGCERVLQELRKIEAKLTKEDILTEAIDDMAKKYLLAWFQHGNDKITGRRKDLNGSDLSQMFDTLSKDEIEQRDRIRSNIQMKSLLKDANLKTIYSNTKSAMINLLKNSNFRASPDTKLQKESFLPKIKPRKHSMTVNSRVTNNQDYEIKEKFESCVNNIEELKRMEINRINHIYFGNGTEMEEKGKLLKRILFGFTVK